MLVIRFCLSPLRYTKDCVRLLQSAAGDSGEECRECIQMVTEHSGRLLRDREADMKQGDDRFGDCR